MIVVGIVGGIASGKSLVTEHLKSLGAVVVDADQVGHEVLRDPDVKTKIRQRWGDAVLTAEGEVDRTALATIVFDPGRRDELKTLESITHPLIQERLRQRIEQIRQSDSAPVVVLDAAIMVKTGWYLLCDEILFVEASWDNRMKRASSRGWSPDMLTNREAMQAPIDIKKQLSTALIDNNGAIEETYRQIANWWNRTVGSR